MTTEVVYVAWNRLEFTRFTFEQLLANTDWGLVDRLVVYDDGSDDGTAEWLADTCPRAPVDVEWRPGRYGGPVAVMNHYLASTEADWFVKVDNDIAVPPGWLPTMLAVAQAETDAGRLPIDLLGMEAGRTGYPHQDGRWDGVHRFEEASHIGGVGLMRVAAFETRPPIPARGRMGFTEWQSKHHPRRGWITPDLAVPQLDRVPFEPWRSLSLEYLARGWQRPWPQMDERFGGYYLDWLPRTREAAA